MCGCLGLGEVHVREWLGSKTFWYAFGAVGKCMCVSQVNGHRWGPVPVLLYRTVVLQVFVASMLCEVLLHPIFSCSSPVDVLMAV